MGLGPGEILLILFVVMLVFGAGRLPALGESLGKALQSFKKAASHSNEIDVTPSAKTSALPADAPTHLSHSTAHQNNQPVTKD